MPAQDGNLCISFLSMQAEVGGGERLCGQKTIEGAHVFATAMASLHQLYCKCSLLCAPRLCPALHKTATQQQPAKGLSAHNVIPGCRLSGKDWQVVLDVQQA